MNFKPNGSLFIFWFLISFISKANGERIEGHAYINNSSSFEDLEIGETSLPFQCLEVRIHRITTSYSKLFETICYILIKIHLQRN